MAIFDFPSTQTSTQSTSHAPPHWKEVTIFTMLAGILAGLVMTILMAAARASGLFAFNLERSFGELLLGTQGDAAFAVGLIIHLAASMIFALIYAEGFRRAHVAGSLIGAGFGIVQWILVGLFVGLMPALRPMLAESLSTAGPFAMNLGTFGFCFLLLVHLLYGAIVGSAFLRMSQEYPEILRRTQVIKRNEYQHE